MLSRASSSRLPKEALLGLVASWLRTNAFGLGFLPAPYCVPPVFLFPSSAITVGSCFFCLLSSVGEDMLDEKPSFVISPPPQIPLEHAVITHRAIKHWLRSEHQLPERFFDTMMDACRAVSNGWLLG